MTEGAARILIISYTPVARSPRVLKQIAVLKQKHAVTTIGFGPCPDEGVEHIELKQSSPYGSSMFKKLRYMVLLLFRQHRLVQELDLRDTLVKDAVGGSEWDVVIAHDVKTIWVANRLSSRRGVLVDLHEYAPRQGDDSWKWRLLIAPYFRWLCRREVVRANAATTVSAGIVDEYRRVYGIDARLVINASPYQELAPVSVASPIRLVHSGACAPGRRIEVMIDAVRDSKAEVTLDLFLVESDPAYASRLRARAEGDERIRFNDPVSYKDLISTLNRFDVGISILAPINFNHLHALPNKLFDYIQARLGVIIGPSPEMRRIVEGHEVGVVSADFTAESLGRVLSELTPSSAARWKNNSHMHALELSSEKQVKVWSEIVDEMISGE